MRLLAYLSRIPRPVFAVAAAALPAAALGALLDVTNASEPRFHPAEPPPPSPWVVARAENTVAGACQIATVVTDVSGAALDDAPLRLTRVGAEGTVEEWRSLTDGDGAHRFLDLPAGTYQLTALVDGKMPASSPEWNCRGADERAFFTLPVRDSEHVLTGAVKSKAGSMASGAELAIAQEHDARTSVTGVARIPVNADGTFSVRLVPGRYMVMAQAPNHAPLVRKITVGDDDKVSQTRFMLTPAPRIRGRVLDEDGTPMANATVALGGVLDPKVKAPSVRTDEQGNFALPVSLGMDVFVTARATTADGGGKTARASLGTALSPFGFTGVDLVVRDGRAVEGVVSKPDGSAWAFGEVRYRIRDLGLSGVEKADGEGRFVLAGMPPDADVEVWAEGNATGAWGAQVASPGNDKLALVYVPPAY
jgi:hypothetical protein